MSALTRRAIRELSSRRLGTAIAASSSTLPVRFASNAAQSAPSGPSEPPKPRQDKLEATKPVQPTRKGTSPVDNSGRGKHRFNFNTSLTWEDDDPESDNYRVVTAAEIAHYREPPTRVKMLVRDFIDDSLYNPHYGYFSKNVTIFTPPDDKGYDFSQFRDQTAFQHSVAERYEAEYGGALPGTPQAQAAAAGQKPGEGLGRQVWHTPTELFKPYFARSLMAAILRQYMRNNFPHEDLIIYEVGAGNGSFMMDALRMLSEEHPEVFAKTQYKIIEISPLLARIQRERATKAGFSNVEVINQDFFKWQGGSSEPCFVVANEVFDNLAHDMIRYEMSTLEPRQAMVCIDAFGDFSIRYERLTDPLLRRVMAYRRLLPPSPATQPPLTKPLLSSAALRNVYAGIPFAPNLTSADFIPTKAVAFLERLRNQLPAHRLLMSDFSELPEAVPGRNGPVVQTRYGNTMVPCGTFLVKQGFFDIFFPTNFELLKDTYSLIMNSPVRSESAPRPKGAKARAALSDDFFSSASVKGFRRRKITVYDQTEFLTKFGGEKEIGPTRTRDGLSPMLGMYANAKIMF